jgi:hypothetical protein
MKYVASGINYALSSSALFTFWSGGTLVLLACPDVIFEQLACRLNDIFLLTLGIFNLSLYKNWERSLKGKAEYS